MTQIWTPAGVTSGAITPWSDDDTIDWESFARHLDLIANSGIGGILINASMAEGGHLTESERDRALEFAVREVGNRVSILATVYGANTREAAEGARRAARAGAAGLLIFPHPAFGGEPLDPSIPAEYFNEIWKHAQLPMIVFRTPASLAPTFDLEVLLRLSELPGVTAIKDSTGNIEFYTGQSEARQFLTPESPLKVLVDYDPYILDFLRAGVHGATVISSVVDPERYLALYENRHSTAADELHRRLAVFARAVYAPPFRDFRARLKEALRHDGTIATAHVRSPLPPLSAQERQAVRAALEASR